MIDTANLIFNISASFSIVSLIFVLYYCRLNDKILILLLSTVVLAQIFWNELPSWTYDLEFVFLIFYILKTRFYIKTTKDKCNDCNLRG